jgi:hypothetical protein
MTTINAFTKQNLNLVRSDITRALMEVEMKYGIRIELGRAKFNEDIVQFSAEAHVVDRGGRAPGQTARGDALAEELKQVAPLAYPKLDITKIITIRGVKYKIVGYNKRAHQYPFVLETVSDRKKYKFAVDDVLFAANAI